MDAGHGPGSDVIGYVTKDNSVLEGAGQVLGEADAQPALNVLKTRTNISLDFMTKGQYQCSPF